MNDWVTVNYNDPTNPTPGGIWVYKTNSSFPNSHFSMSVDNPANTHVGTDAPPASSYYYGMSNPHFAGAPASVATQNTLRAAWTDYFTV